LRGCWSASEAIALAPPNTRVGADGTAETRCESRSHHRGSVTRRLRGPNPGTSWPTMGKPGNSDHLLADGARQAPRRPGRFLDLSIACVRPGTRIFGPATPHVGRRTSRSGSSKKNASTAVAQAREREMLPGATELPRSDPPLGTWRHLGGASSAASSSGGPRSCSSSFRASSPRSPCGKKA